MKNLRNGQPAVPGFEEVPSYPDPDQIGWRSSPWGLKEQASVGIFECHGVRPSGKKDRQLSSYEVT